MGKKDSGKLKKQPGHSYFISGPVRGYEDCQECGSDLQHTCFYECDVQSCEEFYYNICLFCFKQNHSECVQLARLSGD